MAKVTDAATNFIREIFGREKQKKDLSVSTRELLQRSAQGRYPGMDMGGVGGLDEYLGLDRRLLYRFSDYEEMDEYGDISAALDIYSDDSTQTDSSTRKSVWVESNDDEIKKDLENMFYKRLGIEEEIWGMARGLCKYGNEYQEIVVGDEGVADIIYLPPATMRRVENEKTDLLGFVQTFEGDIQIDPKSFEKMVLEQGRGVNSQGNMAVFEDWRVAHMRLRSKNRDSYYGWAVIESARWIWRRLLLLEDAVMVYKLSRSPSRYAFYVDVGNLPRPQAEREMQEVMNRVKKKKFVNPKTGKLDMRFSPLSFDEDFFLAVRDGKESTRVDVLNGPAYQQVEDVQYFLSKLYAALKVPKAYLGYDESLTSRATLCLAGDTKIPLLDGTSPTIKELSRRKDPFWVYSVDKDNNVVPGLAKNARLTRRHAKTVNVELDSGEVLTCTPDHPVMMRDGSFAEANELKSGDSLMPLYRRVSNGKDTGQALVGYEQSYDPGAERWEYTHRIVTDALFEEIGSGKIRHHANFNKRDNRPENIEVMDKQDHFAYHREHLERTLLRPEIRKKRKDAQAEWLKTEDAKESIRNASIASKKPSSRFWDWVHSGRHRKMKSEQMTGQWKDPDGSMRKSRTDVWRKKMSEVMQGRIKSGTAPDTRGNKNAKWREDANLDRLIEVSEEYRCSNKKQLIKWSGYSECLMNRVLSENGISYAQFSALFMVPNKMRDVAYRKYMNHKVVSVSEGPVVDTYDLTVDGYHNFAIGQGVFVHNSQEDVRFCKSVLRVQRELRNGLKKIANVHLAARKIDPSSVDFEVAMTVPSAIFELGQMEIRRTRAEVASMMQAHVSLHWILSKIYGLSDEEIEQISKDKKKEFASMPQGPEGGGAGFESKINSGMAISEQELMRGSRRDEKRVEDKLKKLLEQRDSKLGEQVRQTGALVREILDSIRSQKR
jgi:intein/homing endonuclease